jgi:flagellar hook assembly protein FlgD
MGGRQIIAMVLLVVFITITSPSFVSGSEAPDDLIDNSSLNDVSPINVSLSLSDAPYLNQIVDVTCTVSNFSSHALQAKIEIVLPNEFVFVENDSMREFIIEPGESIQFGAEIMSLLQGAWTIKALVWDSENRLISQDLVYLFVAENFARVRKTYSYELAVENGTAPENLAILEEDWENSENHTAGNSSRITGTIQALRMDGSWGALRGAKVIFLSPSNSILSISYTNWDGNYDSGWMSDEPYYYQTVMSETKSDWGVVVVNGNGDRYSITQKIDGPFTNVTYNAGTFRVLGWDSALDPWRVYDAVVYGWKFLYDEVGYYMPQVKVYYPQNDPKYISNNLIIQPGALLPPDREIWLPEGGNWPNMPTHPDVTLHEYGHVVMGQIYGQETMITTMKSGYWQEYWADFFSIASRNDPHLVKVENFKLTEETYNYEVSGRYPIAAALWDIIDSPEDGLDKINLTFNNLWKIFVAKPTTFSIFWQSLKSELSTWLPDGLAYREAHFAKVALFQNTIDYNNVPSVQLYEISGTDPITLKARAYDLDLEDRSYTSVKFEYFDSGYGKWTEFAIDTTPLLLSDGNALFEATLDPASFPITSWDSSTKTTPLRYRAVASDSMEGSQPNVARLYDFSQGLTDERMAWAGIGEQSPSNPGGSAETSEHAAIANSDDSRWVTSGAPADGYDTQMYRFKISDPTATINKIEMSWEGRGESQPGYDTTLQVWNFKTNGWETLDTRDGMGTEGCLGGTVTNVSDHVSSNGYLYVMARAKHYEPPPQPPENNGGGSPGALTGYVFTYSTRNFGVMDAVVTVSAGSDYSATTGSQGEYTIWNIPSGSWNANVRTDGVTRASDTVTIQSGTVTVKEWYNVPGGTPVYRYGTYGTLSGYVRYTDGTPVVGATVEVLAADGTYSGTTGSYGEYTVWNIPPGTWTVRVKINEVVRATRTVTITSGTVAHEEWSISSTSLSTDYVRVVVYTAPTIAVGESYSASIIQNTVETINLWQENPLPFTMFQLGFPGSDVDLHVYDPEGRHVGWNYETGALELEIPGAEYSGRTANPEWVKVWNSEKGRWRVEAHGRVLEDPEIFTIEVIEDTTSPVSSVEPIGPYWRNADMIPLDVTATASDTLSGVENVELWYRHSPDNSIWGVWTSCGVNGSASYSWPFIAPDGDGYYEFYTVATDRASNVEAEPGIADVQIGVDTIPPQSWTNPFDSSWQNESSFIVTAEASDKTSHVPISVEPSGVEQVMLLYRYSTDNLTWGDWRFYSADDEEPWSWEFDSPEGDGFYQFGTLATDVAGNFEQPVVEQRTLTGTFEGDYHESESHEYGYSWTRARISGDYMYGYLQQDSGFYDMALSIYPPELAFDNAAMVEVSLDDPVSWGEVGPMGGLEPFFSTAYTHLSSPARKWNVFVDSVYGTADMGDVDFDWGWDGNTVWREWLAGYSGDITAQVRVVLPEASASVAVDTTAPEAIVDQITPYWQNASTVPAEITATAYDELSGVQNAELFYRYSPESSCADDEWSDWTSFGVDDAAPWSWSFSAPEGDGCYEFTSVATDAIGNSGLLAERTITAPLTSWSLGGSEDHPGEGYLGYVELVFEGDGVLVTGIHEDGGSGRISTQLILDEFLGMGDGDIAKAKIWMTGTGVSGILTPVGDFPITLQDGTQITGVSGWISGYYDPAEEQYVLQGSIEIKYLPIGLEAQASVGVDTILPQSLTNSFDSHWKHRSSFIVTAEASDKTSYVPISVEPSGVEQVMLFYRHSTDNLTWSDWQLYSADGEEPWNWEFDSPEGDGFYQLGTVALDRAGNREETATADVSIGVDTTPPESSVNQVESYWKNAPALPFDLRATVLDETSGAKNVEFYYRYSPDNSAWDNWTLFGMDNDNSDGWSWSFTAPDGDGYYEFFSAASDAARNAENVTSTVASQVVTDGLVSWWNFEGNADDGWGANDGQIYGATFAEGRVGSAMSFDGGDDYVEVPYAPSLDFNAFSWEAWVNIDRIDPSHGVVAKAYTMDYTGEWLSAVAPNGTMYFGTLTSSGRVDLLGNTSLSPGTWYHVAGTYDGSVMKIYVNGIEDGSAAQSGSLHIDMPLMIGRGGRVGYFDGLMDEVRVYGRALSAEEVMQNCRDIVQMTAEADAQVGVDTALPVTLHELSGVEGNAGWWCSDVGVVLSAADALSGIDQTLYRMDGGTWQAYAGPFVVSGDGVRSVDYCSADIAGNGEDAKSFDLKIDALPPVTSHELSGAVGNASWLIGDVTVTLDAADDTSLTTDVSGPDYTEYRVNGGEWTRYTVPVAISADGVYVIDYRSTDAAGNVETMKSIDFKIDAIPPESFVDPVEPCWHNASAAPFTVTTTASDVHSGVASVELYYRYSLDDFTWGELTSFGSDNSAPYEFEFSASCGDGYYEFYSAAVDAAGNAESIGPLSTSVFADEFSGAFVDTAAWSTGRTGVTYDSTTVTDGKLDLTARAAKAGTYGAVYAVSNSSFDFSQGLVFEVQMSVPTYNAPEDFRSEFYLLPSFTTTANPHDQPDWLRVTASVNREGVRWMLQRRVAGGGVGTLGEGEEIIEFDNEELIDLLHMYTSGPTQKLDGVWRIEIDSENVTVWLDGQLVEPTRPHGLRFTSANAYVCERTKVAPIYTVTFDYVKAGTPGVAADATAGADTTPPVSSVDPIEPYWQSSPFTVTVAATDNMSGVTSVELWYRHSPDNSTWNDWQEVGADDKAPWQWSFSASDGDGFYEFRSAATDAAGNVKNVPDEADARAGVDTVSPESSVNQIEPYWQNASSVPFDVVASTLDYTSGAENVSLHYCYSVDNESWGDWALYGSDNNGSDGWSWRFTAPENDGYYEFYSLAVDAAGNVEEATASQQTCVIFEDGFDDLADGALIGQAGWVDASLRDGVGFTVSQGAAYEGEKGVVSVTHGSTSYRAMKAIPAVSEGRLTVHMMMESGAEQMQFFILEDGSLSAGADVVESGWVRGIVTYYLDRIWFGTVSAPAQRGSWHKVEIEWAAPATVAKVWVDDAYCGESVLFSPVSGFVNGVVLDVPDQVAGKRVYFDAISIASGQAAAAVADARAGVDTATPATGYELAGTLGNAGWWLSEVSLELSASDVTSGVDQTLYRVDSEAWQTYSSPFTVSGDGSHSVDYLSVDVAGNHEPAKTVGINIDTEAPISSADPITPYWANASMVPFELTSTASDGTSGVEKIELSYCYSVDNSTWDEWSSCGADVSTSWAWTFNPPCGDGYYEFYTVSFDFAGNAEPVPEWADARCGVDTVPPTTQCALSGVAGNNGWWCSDVTLTLSASDAASGVELTVYRIDGGEWQDYVDVVVITGDGIHSVEYYSTDIAGNEEQVKSAEVKIDTLPPISSHELSGTTGDGGWWRGDVPVALSSADDASVTADVSGVDYAEYRVDDGEWTAYSSPFTVSGDGIHTVDYRSTDAAGNVETTKSIDVKIDTTPPESSVGPIEPYWCNASAVPFTVTATASDGQSGVSGVELYYRHSPNNSTWDNWTYFGSDNCAPCEFEFSAPCGDGYYEFYSAAVDAAGNAESIGPFSTPVFVDDFSGASVDASAWSTGRTGATYDSTTVTDGKLNLTARATKAGTYGAVYVVSNSSFDFSQGMVFEVQMSVPTYNAPEDFRSEFYLLPAFTTTANPHDQPDWLRVTASVNREGVRWMLQRRVAGGGVGTLGEGEEIIEFDNEELIDLLHMYTSGPTQKLDGVWRIEIDSENVTVWLDGQLVEPTRPHGLRFTSAYAYVCERTKVAPIYTVTFDYVKARTPGFVANATAGVDTAPPEITISSPDVGEQYIAKLDTILIDFAVGDTMDPVPTISAYLTDSEEGTVVMVENGQEIDPLTIDDGFWTLTVEAEDQVGNSASLTTGQFEVTHDIQPPKTTVTVGTPQYSGDSIYVTSATGFTITAVDDLVVVGDGIGLGVDSTEYRVDDGSWITYDAPFTISSEGSHTICYFSTDVIGNVEEVKSLPVVVDDTPPESSVDPISPYWCNTVPLTITATASDELSGVASVELWYRYSSDNLTWSGWQEFGTDGQVLWQWSFSAPDGDGFYEVYSTASDHVQNVEAAPELADAEVCMDTTPPAIENLSVNPYVFTPSSGHGRCGQGTNHRHENETTISYALADSLSPTCEVSVKVYDIDDNLVRVLFSGTEATGASYDHTWDGRDDSGEIVPDGPYTFVVSVVDLAGNGGQGSTSAVVDARPFSIQDAKFTPKRFNPELGESGELDYEISEPAETLSITIYRRNTAVRHLVVDGLRLAGANSEIWDGRDDNGAILPSGTYQVKISAESFAGENAHKQAVARIDNLMPVVANVTDSPDPFSPDNDGVDDTATISYTLLSSAIPSCRGRDDNTLDVTIVIYGASSGHRRTLCDGLDGLFGDDADEDDFDDRGGSFGGFWNGVGQGEGVVRMVRLRHERLEQEPGEQSWTWDGTDSRGRVVANGTYEYTIIARNGWHFSNMKSGTITVERRDTRAPVASDETPHDGSTVQDRTPLISVDLTDDLSGVDQTTIRMTVNGAEVSPTITRINDGYSTRYAPENAFERGAVVEVTVEADDLEGNQMSYAWSFTISRGHGQTGCGGHGGDTPENDGAAEGGADAGQVQFTLGGQDNCGSAGGAQGQSQEQLGDQGNQGDHDGGQGNQGSRNQENQSNSGGSGQGQGNGEGSGQGNGNQGNQGQGSSQGDSGNQGNASGNQGKGKNK